MSVNTDFKRDALEIVKEMTLDEKFERMTTNFKELNRLNIPAFYCGGEAAHGVQERNDQSFEKGPKPEYTTIFQNPVGMCGSFNRELIYDAGKVVGTEARALINERGYGKICAWAPTVDPLRDPRWGRNEEGYSEDPYLVGQMAGNYINGMAGTDDDYLLLGATLKHFYANNNEEGRLSSSSDLSDADRWEYYLETFRQVLKYSKASGAMAAYNAVNGVPCTVNPEIRNILKDCFNLQHTVTDGGGTLPVKDKHHYTKSHKDTVALGIKAGIDMFTDDPKIIKEAVRDAYNEGLISEEMIDEAIVNHLIPYLKSGMSKGAFKDINRSNIATEESKNIARRLQSEGCVLLKNDNNILPLNEEYFNGNNTLSLVGPLAGEVLPDWYGGLSKENITIKDALGSSPKHYDDLLPEIKLHTKEDKYKDLLSISFKAMLWDDSRLTFKDTNTGKYLSTMNPKRKALNTEEEEILNIDSDKPFGWFVKEVFYFGDADGNVVTFADDNALRFWKDGRIKYLLDWKKEVLCSIEIESVKEPEINKVKDTDLVIGVFGTHPMINCKEEIDRNSISLPPFERCIIRELLDKNPNLILILISNYPLGIDEESKSVPAILWSSSGSQNLGDGLVDVITGKVSASGRLTQTWYSEKNKLPDIMDYAIKGTNRTYINNPSEILYPFGYGLSYSKFKLDDFKINSYAGISPVYDKSDITSLECKNKYTRDFNYNNCEKYYDMDNQGFIEVSFSLENVGNYPSDRSVLIMAKLSDGRNKLVGFEKVFDVKPGEKRDIITYIDLDDVRVFDESKKKMVIDEIKIEPYI